MQWVLSYIGMNQPWSYMYSPSRSPLSPHSPPDSSGSSQCTRPEHLSHASHLGWWSVSFSCVSACHYSLMIFCEDFLTFLFFHFLPLVQFYVLWLLWNLCKFLKYKTVLFCLQNLFFICPYRFYPFLLSLLCYCLKLSLFTSCICSKLKQVWLFLLFFFLFTFML